MKSNFISVVLFLLTGFFLTTCENNFLKTWWEDDNDYNYVAIIKDVPIYVYETIVEEVKIYEKVYEIIEKIVVEKYPEYIYVPGDTVYIERPLPPEVLLQHINIQDIQFVIFAGESIEFNGPPGREGAAGSTYLTSQEENTNKSIVNYFADELKNDKNNFAILHGHANKITGTAEEADELEFVSTSRAISVKKALYARYEDKGHGDPEVDLDNRVSTKGYGGGRSLSGSISSYAGLNRRVETILFTIETEVVQSDIDS